MNPGLAPIGFSGTGPWLPDLRCSTIKLQTNLKGNVIKKNVTEKHEKIEYRYLKEKERKC